MNLSSASVITPGIMEELSLSRIKEGGNIREITSEVGELAMSIQQKGLLQPIVVRPVEGHFKIVAGNRRFRACKSLGWRKIHCHVLVLDDRQAFEISLIENLQRKTLNPLDEGRAFIYLYHYSGISAKFIHRKTNPS